MQKLRNKSGRKNSPRNRETLKGLFLDRAGTRCWELHMKNLRSEMDLGAQKHVGYEVWSNLPKSIEKNSPRKRETLKGLFLDRAGTRCWELQMKNLRSKMDLGGRKHVGYEVWSNLPKSIEKNSPRKRETLKGLFLDRAGTRCWELQMKNLRSKMDLGGRKHVGYEVWSNLPKSREKNSPRNRETLKGLFLDRAGTRCWELHMKNLRSEMDLGGRKHVGYEV
ncbi:hypothetical protein CDL15_Pgr009159 [Punica granatum]|uniref:Uncharacterized protein n=1 Tax=Punica granatum TaxID=22663 RepID=A0A218WKZ3_PUNGR|nr:hypothetical protein CDL15_Pgr009159 [Punica granatum]